MHQFSGCLQIAARYFVHPLWAVLVLVSCLYLFFRADKKYRPCLIAAAAAYVIFGFNDLMYRITGIFINNNVYYRFLWIVPAATLIACAGADLMKKGASLWKKILFFGILTGCLLVSGGGYVSDGKTALPDNAYQLDDDVLALTEAIRADGASGKYRIVLSSDLDVQFRLYDANAVTVVSRTAYLTHFSSSQETAEEEEVTGGGEIEEAVRVMIEAAEYGRIEDPSALREALADKEAEYLVARKDWPVMDSLIEAGCQPLAEGRTYMLYRVGA
ncbi:MAG: hypothetical protein PUA52_04395 [Lachnospiraceae bacterium]|nr:hypothetical protein [Lachnospiraceae bacterium]